MTDIFDKSGPLLRKHFNTSQVKAILRTSLDLIEEQENKGVESAKTLALLKHLMTKTLNAIEKAP